MQDFKKRLVEFARVRYDMGQTRFEEMCGIHPGTISAIKANGPTASVVTKIAFACPELNLNWLFRGTGEMLISESPSMPAGKIVMNEIHDNPNVIIAYLQDAVKGAIKDAYQDIIKNKI